MADPKTLRDDADKEEEKSAESSDKAAKLRDAADKQEEADEATKNARNS